MTISKVVLAITGVFGGGGAAPVTSGSSSTKSKGIF